MGIWKNPFDCKGPWEIGLAVYSFDFFFSLINKVKINDAIERIQWQMVRNLLIYVKYLK